MGSTKLIQLIGINEFRTPQQAREPTQIPAQYAHPREAQTPLSGPVLRVRLSAHHATRRADVDKNVSPHWMRHAHASHALDRGAAVHLVQATLGHSSVATTGRYLHARPTESSSKYLAV